MLYARTLIWPLALLSLEVAGLVITRVPEQNALMSTPVTVTAAESVSSFTSPTLAEATAIAPSPIGESASVVTPAPGSSGVPLQRRQPCCFNEQGFRVDCDTWTGYYYTWGPSGNPYEGGPQCDGNWNGDGSANGGSGGSDQNGGSGGSGDSGGQVTVYENSAVDVGQPEPFLFAGVTLLLLGLIL